MQKKQIINEGHRFNNWTVIKELEKRGKHRIFLCKCDCGREYEVIYDTLKTGTSKMCRFCGHKDKTSTHKESKTSLYYRWCHIKRRAGRDKYYKHISICEEWENSYETFRDWALSNGYKENLTIDRIDPLKGYEPNNCRWVTYSIQNSHLHQWIPHTSKYKGVNWYKRQKLWSAEITVNHKHIHIGRFNSEKEAALAYNYYIVGHALQRELNKI